MEAADLSGVQPKCVTAQAVDYTQIRRNPSELRGRSDYDSAFFGETRSGSKRFPEHALYAPRQFFLSGRKQDGIAEHND
jgi:hypothetical protein